MDKYEWRKRYGDNYVGQAWQMISNSRPSLLKEIRDDLLAIFGLEKIVRGWEERREWKAKKRKREGAWQEYISTHPRRGC